MVASNVEENWFATLSALRREVDRVTTLLRSIGAGAGAGVLGQWNFSDIAAHLAQVWIAVPGLAAGDMFDIQREMGGDDALPTTGLVRELGDLSTLTTNLTAFNTERDPSVLADRIEARAERYFAACVSRDPESLRPWIIEGIMAPVATFAAHLLSENVVHGYDIATAAGQPWLVEPDHARLALEQFLFPVMAKMDPRALVNADNAAGFRARYEIRIRGGRRFRLRFDDGAVHVEPHSSAHVDCYISADPVALLLLTWGRQGQWPAILRGKITAWGRRPWLASRLPGLMKNP